MDEILQNCRNLCSQDFGVRARAYQALRNTRAFTATMYHFRETELTAYELARLLTSDASEPLAGSAHRVLGEYLAETQAAA
jgi:hypothetical protein